MKRAKGSTAMTFPDDIEGLLNLFAGRRYGPLADGPAYAANPYALALTVELQRKLVAAGELTPEAPCTVFLFGQWDGVYPFGTRIGGRPARDHSLPWPTSVDGKPLNFLAQLDFIGIDDLPIGVPSSSLLSIYAEIVTGYRDMNLQFEWQSRETATLASEDQLPGGVGILQAFQGKPFAAMDYVSVDPNRFDPGTEEKYIPALWGTKIGGLNPVREAILDDRNWGRPPEQHITSLGAFLGTIGCVQGTPDAPWPFIDREKPMTFDDSWSNQFLLADMGMIVLHVHENGSIEWDPCLG